MTGDPQDGVLGPNAFTWQILFEHHSFSNPNHHTHPFFPRTTGIAGGTVTLNFGETDPDVWYRIFFTAQDSYGLSTTIFRDVFPRHTQLSLSTTPVPLKIRLFGVNKNTPLDFWSVINTKWTLGADTPQTLDGLTYDFYSWSDGGSRYHNINAPPTNTDYVGQFLETTSLRHNHRQPESCSTYWWQQHWCHHAFLVKRGNQQCRSARRFALWFARCRQWPRRFFLRDRELGTGRHKAFSAGREQSPTAHVGFHARFHYVTHDDSAHWFHYC